jgi:peroxiredoxin-like protein
MKDLPHIYKVIVAGNSESNLTVSAEKLPALEIAPPSQFGGPGDLWSPENLLMASVASCLVLSFRAIAKASKLEWLSIECESAGELAKDDKKIHFTNILTKAKLSIPATENIEKAKKLLNKAEETCLISNSLSCESRLEYEVIINGE